MRRAVAWLRSAGLSRVPVFSAGVDLSAFAGYDSPLVSGWAKDGPLLDVFEREHIGLATFEDRLLGRERFASDPQVGAFLLDPAAQGFCEAYAEPGSVRIFVRVPRGEACPGRPANP
jgi:hypothetical protein